MLNQLLKLDSYTNQISQLVPEELCMPHGKGTPGIKSTAFTIKPEDYSEATKIFNEIARSKDISIRQDSGIQSFTDYGGGLGLYETLSYSFQPKGKEGLDSPALKMRISNFLQEFQEKLDEKGIRNYAPASGTSTSGDDNESRQSATANGVNRIYNTDTPRPNPLDTVDPNDIEIFIPHDERWISLATQETNESTNKKDDKAEPMDFEIKSDGKGGWQKA